MAGNPFGAALDCIPEHQRSIFLTQLLQLLPQHIPTRLGFLARVDAPEGTGLFWALSLDAHRLVTVIRVAVHEDYALHEHPTTDYSCIGLMCESSMRMMDQIRASDMPQSAEREAWSPSAVSLHPLFEHEETTAFRIEAGKYRFNLAPNTIHSSTCLHLLPGYFDALEREYPGAFTGLEHAIAQNASYPEAHELRSLLRGFSPRMANRPEALLYYRGLADQTVAALVRHIAT